MTVSVGSVLIGLSALAVVMAYLARPFRASPEKEGLNENIEVWVDHLREEEPVTKRAGAVRPGEGAVDDGGRAINFCPQCGREVGSEDRFCSGCGTRLRGGTA